MKENIEPPKDTDGLVAVEIDNIDDKTWSMLVAFAKKEGKTVDQVASEAIQWAVETGKVEQYAEELKKENDAKKD